MAIIYQGKYEAVIGLEIHVQLDTASKLFCGDSTAFGAAPNTHISPITLALPGTLPKINKKAIEYAVRLGLACQCEIMPYNFLPARTIFIRICQKAGRPLNILTRFVWGAWFL
ncbi:hypothetical protein [Arachidicoccus ginsenosidivorans]|uniref:hypothetical protein n=1 Tax=Arachidicoccus ginsenosidivorans TaxID=496057 RepID=UPI0021D35926|nr:hypothetical protein [Arachidicoccus ginsenosidivorans]